MLICIRGLETEENLESGSLDLKTVNRVLDTLTEEKKIKLVSISIPYITGSSKIHQFIMLPDLPWEDPLVQEKISFLQKKTKTQAPNEFPAPIAVGKNISEVTLPERLRTRDRTPVQVNPTVAFEQLLKYGLIKSKFARLRAFHQFLCKQHWDYEDCFITQEEGLFFILIVNN